MAALRELNAQQMPDMDTDSVNPGDVSQSDIPSANSLPSGGLGGSMGSSKDVPPSVGQHETVIKSQSH